MKIHELYTDESKWTQGAKARDSQGNITLFDVPEASCFCLFGAILKCYPNDKERKAVVGKIRIRINLESIISWNDNPERNFTEVKQLVLDLDI